MSVHACSTDPCPSCNPRDYEAARTLAENDKAAALERRYVLYGPELAELLRGTTKPHDKYHAERVRALLAKVEGR